MREIGCSRSPLSDQISADLKRRGMKFVGSVTIYSYLQAVGIINSMNPAVSYHHVDREAKGPIGENLIGPLASHVDFLCFSMENYRLQHGDYLITIHFSRFDKTERVV